METIYPTSTGSGIMSCSWVFIHVPDPLKGSHDYHSGMTENTEESTAIGPDSGCESSLPLKCHCWMEPMPAEVVNTLILVLKLNLSKNHSGLDLYFHLLLHATVVVLEWVEPAKEMTSCLLASVAGAVWRSGWSLRRKWHHLFLIL